MVRPDEERWSPLVVKTMKDAGWEDSRRVDTTEWRDELAAEGFEMHDAAAVFLRELGGLAVEAKGGGRDMARMGFRLDPLLCSGQKPWFDELSEGTAGDLFPIGEEFDGNASLAIDRDGVVHMLFNQRRVQLGPGREALARLLEGRR